MGKTVVYFVKSAEYGTYFLVVSRCVDAAVNIANEGVPSISSADDGRQTVPSPCDAGQAGGAERLCFRAVIFTRRDALYLI